MASSYTSLALGGLLLMSCVSWGSATVYTVGDSQGWGFGVNYSTWASGKKFAVGDQLVFNYQSGQHTVTEVSSSDYNSCSDSNPISSTSTGPTTITLTTAGPHYYICAITGHCSAGMKLAVDVATPSSSSPYTQPPQSLSPAPLAAPSSSSPSTPPTKSTSPAPLATPATPSTSTASPLATRRTPSTSTASPLATPTTPSTSTASPLATPTTPSTSTAAAPSTPTASAPANSHAEAATGLVPTVSAVAAIAGLVAMLF